MIQDRDKQPGGSLRWRQLVQTGGPAALARILNGMGPAAQATILAQIEATDPDTAKAVRARLFVFADLARLRPTEIQLLLRQVEQADLVLSLKNTTADLKETLLAEISTRVRGTIEEELEAMGPVRLSTVEEAQQNIVAQVLQLAERGQLFLPRVGDDEVWV